MRLHYLLLFISIFISIVTASAQQINNSTWYTFLPDCPCRNPDLNGIKLHDGWAKDKGDLSKYHKGAYASYRSYPYVKTSAGNSCQQCCYDAKGNLITVGRGAGTPDKVSSCVDEDKNGVMKIRLFGLIGHYFKDVSPWNKLMKKDSSGWKTYNKFWVPNKGTNCLGNVNSFQN